jgi:transposase
MKNTKQITPKPYQEQTEKIYAILPEVLQEKEELVKRYRQNKKIDK